MHKIFAKTLFLGKNLIYLPHCHSTNEEVKSLSKSSHFPEGSVIWADYQEKGRGQKGNAWLSEAGKNLLFTIYLKPDKLMPADQFRLNIVLSLALSDVLKSILPDQKIEIKWPNDLYCNDRKIAGILVETTINAGRVEQVYCGIGLNVNQSFFNLRTATSITIESDQMYDRESLLEQILIQIEKYLEGINQHSEKTIVRYVERLRWMNEPHLFLIDGVQQEGIITGIGKTGKLLLTVGNYKKSFDVKEIEFIR